MNIRDIKRKKITEMTTDEILAERKFYEDVIANCKYEKPQDIADLFEAYTMLIWKHKQVQATCPVMPDDTPETLAARVHALEYEHFPQVIEKILM